MSTDTPLVFLPGMLNDGRLWQAQIEALGDGRKTIVADFIAADSIEALAENVLAYEKPWLILIWAVSNRSPRRRLQTRPQDRR